MELNFQPELGFAVTPRVLIYERPEMEASVQWFAVGPGQYMPFFHFDLHERWSVWLFRHAKKKFDSWIADWKSFPIFTHAEEDSEVLDRLREHFGFTYFGEIPCTDGKNRRLYVHYGPKRG